VSPPSGRASERTTGRAGRATGGFKFIEKDKQFYSKLLVSAE